MQISKRKVKYVDITEFREKGYLQEVNRRFFHPIGTALEISIFKWYEGFLYHIVSAFKMLIPGTRKEEITGVWDYRENPEGMYFDFAHMHDSCNPLRITQALLKEMNIEAEIFGRRKIREKMFGNYIEPIPVVDNRK
jgi:hypothetical protein